MITKSEITEAYAVLTEYFRDADLDVPPRQLAIDILDAAQRVRERDEHKRSNANG